MSAPSPTIRATINGESHDLPEGLSILDLLARFGLDGRHTAVERNRQLVPRAQFATTPVAAGDDLEIVTLVGGG